MKASAVREMTPAELENKLQEIEESLFNLSFKSSSVKLDNPKKIKIMKKDIARIKTILREKQAGGKE